MPVHHTDAERLWRRRRKLEARAAAAKRRAARQAERAAPLWAVAGSRSERYEIVCACGRTLTQAAADVDARGGIRPCVCGRQNKTAWRPGGTAA
jgi:hypothetical protein